MANLINLNVYPAQNVICVWNEKDPKARHLQGLSKKDSKVGMMLPRLIVVGVFSDGTTKAAGIKDWNDINVGEQSNLFFFDEFRTYVSRSLAEAFVRCEVGLSDNIQGAKDTVYEKLLNAGVKILDEAREYLTTKE